MVRVLHIFHCMANGGIEHFVMDYYRRIDRSKIQFDFLTSVDTPGAFDDEILSLGGHLYRAYPFNKNPVKNFYDISNIVRKNNYDIVHRHTGSAFGYYDLRAARHGGATHLIIHAHNPQAGHPFIHKLSKHFLQFDDCIRLACSNEAGKFLFEGKSFTVWNNTIDSEKFRFNSFERAKIRSELNIEDKFCIGHIGRLEYQKNHKKLLEIFSKILIKRPKSVLVCVGEGSYLERLMMQAEKYGIKNSVLFLGNRNDVNSIIQAFDVFVFPSLYEGFGITLIEAQANGLMCFTSKDLVPTSADITGNVEFLPITASAQLWADNILNCNNERDLNATNTICEKGYDLNQSTEKIEKMYMELAGEI